MGRMSDLHIEQQEKALTVVFFRNDGFYPIELLPPEECGKSIAEQAADNAACNPGTIRVEDFDGNVLWRVQ